MSYTIGCHTVFHHRYHIVWVPKYRYKILEGDIRLHIRGTIRQVCRELRRTYWGKMFWARGYFCTTSGNITHALFDKHL